MPRTTTRSHFPDIAPIAWEHPADAAALNALRSVPGFDRVVKATVGRLNELALGRQLLGDAKPASSEHHKRLYDLHQDVLKILDAPRDWPLWVKPMKGINAATAGMDKPFIVISAEADGHLSDDQVRVILGHEIGHILSGHVLYKTMLGALLSMGWAAAALPSSLPVVLGVMAAMLEWDRRSELSADRASAIVVGGHEAVAATLRMVAPDEQVLWGQASRVPKEWVATLDRMAKGAGRLIARHPPIPERIEELERWTKGESFHRIMNGVYPRRSLEPRPGTMDGWKEQVSTLGRGLREMVGPITDVIRWG